MKRVTVLGSGGWGTALSVHLARLGKEVHLWGRDESLIADLTQQRVNTTYLPDIEIPAVVTPTSSLEVALLESECIVLALPSHGVREVLRQVSRLVRPGAIIVSATKGLEVGTLLRMSEVIEQELGLKNEIAVLSGPSFAIELAREAPTAVSVASRSEETLMAVQQEFRARYLRLYASSDVIGVEMGGALKNIIAIASGVVESLELGHNARSALITRGLAEISRLTSAVGGQRETVAGLSGLGDLVLTCTGGLSRNRRVGIELGKGRALADILAGMRTVAEGVRTTRAALELGVRHEVELPIASQMAKVLEGHTQPRAAVENLMLRRQRSELETE